MRERSRSARTVASLRPVHQLGGVVLSSAFPTGVPDGLADGLFDLVEHGSLTRDWIAGWNPIYAGIGAAFAASGEPYESAPASPAPALPASAYTGVFANDYVGTVEISGKSAHWSCALVPCRRCTPSRTSSATPSPTMSIWSRPPRSPAPHL
jgi:hypothetical protein